MGSVQRGCICDTVEGPFVAFPLISGSLSLYRRLLPVSNFLHPVHNPSRRLRLSVFVRLSVGGLRGGAATPGVTTPHRHLLEVGVRLPNVSSGGRVLAIVLTLACTARAAVARGRG